MNCSYLLQDAGVMTDQRISDSGCFASKPLLQPTAKPLPECAGALFEKSFRQIESAVLQLHFAGLDHRH